MLKYVYSGKLLGGSSAINGMVWRVRSDDLSLV